ncbi:hypothetical protein JCM5350_001708 [Sporobolomyces pararoseus]
MPGWPERRLEVIAGLEQFPERETHPALSSDELLHRAVLRCIELQSARKDLPPNLRRIASNSLSIEDFRSLATLSSSGPFNQVELVGPESTLTGTGRLTSKLFVVKTVDRRWAFRMRQQQSIAREITILRLASSNSSPSSASPRIPRLIASFLSQSSCHLVLSHASGGDLWGLLETSLEGKDSSQNEGLPEEWVKFWIAQLVDAVEWLHNQGWAHRDIKPHNLLLLSSGHLQLTDFGSAAPLSPAPLNTTASTSSLRSTNRSVPRKFALALVGTPDYIAPEVLQYAEQVAEESNDFESSLWRDSEDERAYGNEVDWWATGVVLYELLFGQAPFFAEAIPETYERIINFQEYLKLPETANVSQDARDFISRLLVESVERPNVLSIKGHRWFRQIDWSKLRTTSSPYTPPPFQPPAISPSQSFSHQRQSSASFTTFSNSFFSSPGLSILRPSPSTLEGAKREEQKYWEAVEFGGLTTLPPPDAFTSPSSSSETSPSSSSNNHPSSFHVTSTPAPETHSPPLILSIKDMSRFSFETPARPLRSQPRFNSTRKGSSGNATPNSSARSRRLISDVEAWKEMQEHAWEVGMSAKKQHRKGISTAEQSSVEPRGSRREIQEVEAYKVETSRSEAGEGKRDLGSLEARHEEMVKELEEMGKKYGSLFALADKEAGSVS